MRDYLPHTLDVLYVWFLFLLFYPECGDVIAQIAFNVRLSTVKREKASKFADKDSGEINLGKTGSDSWAMCALNY